MSQTAFAAFDPPFGLRNRHVQTLIGSRGRSRWIMRRAAALLACSETRTLTTPAGVRLQALTSLRAAGVVGGRRIVGSVIFGDPPESA